MDKFRGYRTLAINIATLIILLGGSLTGTIENPETLRYIAIGVTLANVVLRWLTTTPIRSSV